jgi:hypothetical protein
MIKIEWIVERVKKNKYYFSKHGDQERQNENLLVSEIEEALISGRILEKYEDSGRGESCLVVGYANSGKPIHIICGQREEELVSPQQCMFSST